MNITKLKILNIVNLVTFIVFILAVVLQYIYKIIDIRLLDFIVVGLFVAIAISLLFKSVLFKSDNALWFGLLLMIYAGLQVYFNFVSVGFTYKLFWYMLSVAFCSYVVGAVFKERFPLRLALVFTFISAPIYLHAVFGFNTIIYIVLVVIAFIVGYFIQSFIPKRNKISSD